MKLEEMILRLEKVDTANIADADKSIRTLDKGIRPVKPGLKMIGLARTIRCKGDFLTVINGLHDAIAGEVLVIDTQNTDLAVVGGLFSMEALRKSLSGIVIDGACRDVANIRELNFPLYSRSFNPVSGTTCQASETQVPVKCGGIMIQPGEIIFGDDDGVIVVSREELSRLITIAEDIHAKEEHVINRMKSGESLIDMLNFDEHWENVKSNQRSELKFRL